MALRSLMLAAQLTPSGADELMRRIESGSGEIGAMLTKKSLSLVVRKLVLRVSLSDDGRARPASRCSRSLSSSAQCSGLLLHRA